MGAMKQANGEWNSPSHMSWVRARTYQGQEVKCEEITWLQALPYNRNKRMNSYTVSKKDFVLIQIKTPAAHFSLSQHGIARHVKYLI